MELETVTLDWTEQGCWWHVGESSVSGMDSKERGRRRN